MVMTGKDTASSSPGERDSSDGLTQFLIEYLQHNTPEGTLDEVYRLVDVARGVATLTGEETWTPYAERRSMLEATGIVLGGGADSLAEIGRSAFNSIRRV